MTFLLEIERTAIHQISLRIRTACIVLPVPAHPTTIYQIINSWHLIRSPELYHRVTINMIILHFQPFAIRIIQYAQNGSTRLIMSSKFLTWLCSTKSTGTYFCHFALIEPNLPVYSTPHIRPSRSKYYLLRQDHLSLMVKKSKCFLEIDFGRTAIVCNLRENILMIPMI